jgi:hypothetical protein
MVGDELTGLIMCWLRHGVGNVHYRDGKFIFPDMSWEDEKRRASGPTDSIHTMPS